MKRTRNRILLTIALAVVYGMVTWMVFGDRTDRSTGNPDRIHRIAPMTPIPTCVVGNSHHQPCTVVFFTPTPCATAPANPGTVVYNQFSDDNGKTWNVYGCPIYGGTK